MAAKAAYPGPEDALALYEAVVARNPAIDRKGAKNPYTSRNGHMFSFLDADGHMALRLSESDGAAFLDRYDSGPVEQYGSVMRGYVAVPDELLADTDALESWFDRSHDWIGTLPPKPTKGNK